MKTIPLWMFEANLVGLVARYIWSPVDDPDQRALARAPIQALMAAERGTYHDVQIGLSLERPAERLAFRKTTGGLPAHPSFRPVRLHVLTLDDAQRLLAAEPEAAITLEDVALLMRA